jgi:hypothetical protein
MIATQPTPQIRPIESPNELPGGLYRGLQFASEEEARAAGQSGLLYKSKILTAWYLFVKVAEESL